jgi:hypothetical protein
VSSHDAPSAQASPQIHPSSHGASDCQLGKRSAVLAISNPYAHDGPPHAYSPPTHATAESQLGRSSPRPGSAAPPHYTPSSRALVRDGERDSEVEYHVDFHAMHTTGGSQAQQHAGRGEAAGRGPDAGYHPPRHHPLLHGPSGGMAEGRHEGMASEEVRSPTSQKHWPCLPTVRWNPKANGLLHVQFRQGSSGYESSASSHAAQDEYRPSSNMAPASLEGATSV